MKKLYIIGSGGFSKQVIELVQELRLKGEKIEIVGLIDDDPNYEGIEILGTKVLGNTEYLNEISKISTVYAVVAIANGDVKKRLSQKLKYVKWLNLIHPEAIVSKYSIIGVGNIICAGVIINPECRISNHCHINIGVTIGHDVTIKDYVTIMPGGRISGNVVIGEAVMFGTGAIILQGLSIDDYCTIGAGAVLIKNAQNKGIYVGVPAKKIERNSGG